MKKTLLFLVFCMVTSVQAAAPAPWHMGDALKEGNTRNPSSDFDAEIEDGKNSPVILEEELERVKKIKKAGVKPASESDPEEDMQAADYKIVEP
jgi:hypothetical protein